MNNDLFSTQTAHDLFSEIQSAYMEYHHNPTSRLVLFLLFSLNHLREWTAECSYETINQKCEAKTALTPAEVFYCDIWKLKEFQIINELCNRSKHFNVKNRLTTSITEGLTVCSPVSDSLGQTYFRVDGVDSREIFFPIIQEYRKWFEANPNL